MQPTGPVDKRASTATQLSDAQATATSGTHLPHAVLVFQGTLAGVTICLAALLERSEQVCMGWGQYMGQQGGCWVQGEGWHRAAGGAPRTEVTAELHSEYQACKQSTDSSQRRAYAPDSWNDFSAASSTAWLRACFSAIAAGTSTVGRSMLSMPGKAAAAGRAGRDRAAAPRPASSRRRRCGTAACRCCCWDCCCTSQRTACARERVASCMTAGLGAPGACGVCVLAAGATWTRSHCWQVGAATSAGCGPRPHTR